MADFTLSQLQNTVQQQKQYQLQQQIQTIKLLALNSHELRDEIYKEVENNPALTILNDPYSEGSTKITTRSSTVHVGKTSASGQLDSDTYQTMLESSPDNRDSLTDHLLHQLNMIKLSDAEQDLCEKLINNLDDKGYHILAPESFLDKSNPSHDLLEDCLYTIHQLEPVGVCCKNLEESLMIQAENKKANKIVLFLCRHLDFIVPKDLDKTQKKIYSFLEERKKLAFNTEEEPNKKDFSLEEIQKAIDFIKGLNPYPAQDYSSNPNAQYIRPDVYVVMKKGILDVEKIDEGLIYVDNFRYLKVVNSNDVIPTVELDEGFTNKELAKGIQNKEDKSFMNKHVANAKAFIQNLDFRQNSILKYSATLVKEQKDFFLKGPGHLKPLLQKDFASIIDVADSTVSRFAESKFISCHWGIFPVKYFFTTGVKTVSPKTTNSLNKEEKTENLSTDTVKIEIEKILKSQKAGEKKLSDQKVSDMLLEKGIKVARRTVAKYRSQLNIDSSYTR